MATVLEKLKQNLGQVGGTVAPTNATGEIQSLLAARRGIVGQPTTALRGRSVTEAAAAQQSQEQLAAAGEAGTMAQIGLGQAEAQQAQEQQARETAIKGQQEEARLQTRLKTENILRELEEGRASLGEDKRQARLETITAGLRLQNKKYIDDLRREGEKSRLTDALRFNEELAKTISAENQALLGDFYKTQELLDASDRDFNKYMERMGAGDVLAALRAQSRGAETTSTIGGISELAKTSLGAYKAAEESKEKQDKAEKKKFRTIDENQYESDSWSTT